MLEHRLNLKFTAYYLHLLNIFPAKSNENYVSKQRGQLYLIAFVIDLPVLPFPISLIHCIIVALWILLSEMSEK